MTVVDGWHDLERNAEPELTAGLPWVVDCADCGEEIRIGSWPFCRSQQNPQGHERGCYGWHFGGS